jgi:hypothetical protein
MKSDLTESEHNYMPSRNNRTMPAQSIRPEDVASVMGSVQGSNYSGPIFMKTQNLLPPHKPTPNYQKGDLVNVKCSDGHWYRGKLLDVGEQAVLVEYKRKKEKFHKRLPIRSRLLRFADSRDVETIKAVQSAKASSTRQVPLEMIMNKSKEFEKQAFNATMEKPTSKTPKVESRKTMNKTMDLEEKASVKTASKKTTKMETTSITDSNTSHSDSREHVEVLRSDGVWYEAYIVKTGAKAQIVEYVSEGKKFQKTLSIGSSKIAPYGTHLLIAEIGDDVEYLTSSGTWVKAQVCEIKDAHFVILYMEGSDLVEKEILRCSKNLARYGEHVGLQRRSDRDQIKVDA